MSTPSLAPPAAATAAAANRAHGRGQRMLRRAAMAWLACAGLGQLLFALYVAGFYGRTTLAGQPQRWNEVMPHGYVAGDSTFNAVLGLHLLLAVAIIVAGLMQLSPALRQRLPRLHRWIGRGYVLAAALLAIGGLLMVWVRRGAAGDTAQHLGTSLNALLILWFAAMAWWRARQGRLGAHRPWALRLFLAVAGVWFFRIGLMLWLLLNQGPAGFDPVRFSGPALTTLAFAQTLLPLAVLELYLLAQRRRSALLPWLGSGVLALAALATLVGSLAAAAMMWWPALSG